MICFLIGLWLSFRHGIPLSGHDFFLETTNKCGCVEVLRCNRCTVRSIGWV